MANLPALIAAFQKDQVLLKEIGAKTVILYHCDLFAFNTVDPQDFLTKTLLGRYSEKSSEYRPRSRKLAKSRD